MAVPSLLAVFGTVILPLLNFSLGQLQRPVRGLVLILSFAAMAARSISPLRQAWRNASNATHDVQQPSTESPTKSLKRSSDLLFLGLSFAFTGSLLLSYATEALVKWNPDSQWWSFIMPILATHAPAIAIVSLLSTRGEINALMAYAFGSIITYATVGYGTAWMAAYGRTDYNVARGSIVWTVLSGNAITLSTLVNARYVRTIGIVLLALMTLLACTGDWKPPKYFVVD